MANMLNFQSQISCKCNGNDYIFTSNTLSLPVETKKIVPKITYYTPICKEKQSEICYISRCGIIYLALILGL